MADSRPQRPIRIMPLLIDGYNLLHVTGFLGRNVGPGSLERARQVLLNFLAKSLDAEDRDETTIVFDAANAPWGAASEQQYRRLQIRYAVGYEDADALLEELIRTDSAPRRLTVVSSDHRVQRAALRRRATAVDADVWFEQLHRQRRRKSRPASAPDQKPEAPNTEEEVVGWMQVFGDGPIPVDDLSDPPIPTASADAEPEPDGSTQEQPDSESEPDFYDPFPPGYGEDLLRDED